MCNNVSRQNCLDGEDIFNLSLHIALKNVTCHFQANGRQARELQSDQDATNGGVPISSLLLTTAAAAYSSTASLHLTFIRRAAEVQAQRANHHYYFSRSSALGGTKQQQQQQ